MIKSILGRDQLKLTYSKPFQSPAVNAMLAFDNKGREKSFLATDDIRLYVTRYRLYNEQVFRGNDTRVLKVQFEDLVSNCEEAVRGMLNFLDLDKSSHVRRKIYFNASTSSQSVGL